MGATREYMMSISSIRQELIRLATSRAEYRRDLVPLVKAARSEVATIKRMIGEVEDEIKATERLEKMDAAFLTKAKANVSSAEYRRMEKASRAAQKLTDQTRKMLQKRLMDLQGLI